MENTLKIANTATIISKEEIEEIVGQTLIEGTYLGALGAPAFLYGKSYWTRSAYNDVNVWYIGFYGGVYNNYASHECLYGVRPVVTISATLI